ncbi:uncharacterized protein LOC108198271 [Daucus carota subsp. sativus]|uniref:uncharacterized protein LOC108198271 n=1 Tax=Daucus carota subsp. sativus TaxID=79200 RepID=UPI003082EB7F
MSRIDITDINIGLKIDGSPNIGSQQGSCSKGGLENVLELTAVKKKLDLNESPRGEDAENNFQEVDDEEKNKDKEKDVAELKSSGEEKGVEYLVVEDKDVEVAEENEGILWELAIGTPTNIVAHATVDFVTAVLHGKPLGGDNVRVSITRVIQGAAEIPFPIDDEIITVDQAVGTFIAWPKNMLLEVKANSDRVKSRAVKGGKKNGPRKMKKVNDLVSEPEPVAFKLSEEAFGSSDKKCLFKSDISAVCFGGEISGTVICMFINILQENLRKHKMTDMISFVDPAKIGALGCGTPAARSRALALRFKSAKPSQVFLLPYHHTNHWALTVVNPDAQMVYHLDPLKRRIANEEWIEVVNNGIKIYKEDVKRFLKKKINWENLAGVPAQIGTTDCGLFVMLYMREICIDKELKFASKWARRSNLVFDSDDLNEIRSAWAKYFMRQHAS